MPFHPPGPWSSSQSWTTARDDESKKWDGRGRRADRGEHRLDGPLHVEGKTLQKMGNRPVCVFRVKCFPGLAPPKPPHKRGARYRGIR
jgi:hypothetical protein